MKQEIQIRDLIKDGNHEGEIIGVEYRDEPYKYTDYKIELKDVDGNIAIRYGVPSEITVDKEKKPTNKHAKLLHELGLLKGDDVDPDNAKGLKISFNTSTDQKGFAKIDGESIKKI